MPNTKYNINSDDPLEMVWAIREKISDETKNMSREEYRAYIRQASENAKKDMARLRDESGIDILKSFENPVRHK
ncbi:MAG: hypothetical protein ACRC2T_18980 [Thermoguttaceae bacterium]